MSSIRRAISLVIALALFVGGSGFLIYLFAFAAGFKWFMAVGAGFVACLGAYWLYEDFVDAKPNSQNED